MITIQNASKTLKDLKVVNQLSPEVEVREMDDLLDSNGAENQLH